MEGESEECDKDVQREVLWKKCIQQSIFVDLSEDESLHLSDLERSLALRLSQAESAASDASFCVDVSDEMSALDDSSSESSAVRSPSKRGVPSKSRTLHMSAQRPNTMQDEGPLKLQCEDLGHDTSDEDQEDLPYDGDLGSLYFNHTGSSQSNVSSDGKQTLHGSPDVLSQHEGADASTPHAEKLTPSSQEEDRQENHKVSPPCTLPRVDHHRLDFNQLLGRHFSQEELLIEAETLPEVSLLESVDDALLSSPPTRNSTDSNSPSSENQSCRTDEKGNPASQILEEETEEDVMCDVSDNVTSGSVQGSREKSTLDVTRQEKSEDKGHVQKPPGLVRARSFSEMKYGQGQVHYPPPDFSKVAPKVKIPKSPCGPARPVPQARNSMNRAQSSPGMLEVINRVLEDSAQPSDWPRVFKEPDQETAPALVHHLQAEYDKLLTKYAEAENLLDKMRIETNPQLSSTVILEHDDGADDDEQGNIGEGGHLGFLAPQIPPSDKFDEKLTGTQMKELDTADLEGSSDGEKMTAELRGIIDQFMQTVVDFKQSLSNISVCSEEQQMMLRSMMEAQDQLERKYISKKEEHRMLEMKNYMGLSRNTGTFDPSRLVEGDIFRVGMHLEDIKELIDKNLYLQISPILSPLTPTPMTEAVKTLCKPTVSTHHSPLHEGPAAGYQMQIQAEEGKEEEEECERMTNDSQPKYSVPGCYSSWSAGSSLEVPAAEDEEGEHNLSQGIVSRNISAYQRGTSSPSRERQQTPGRVLSCGDEGEQVDCVSLAVEVSSVSDAPTDPQHHSEPPRIPSSLSQRIVSPETDSGFGSSYLRRAADGTFHLNLLRERIQSDRVSSSDSEGSHQETTIHSPDPHPSVQTQYCTAAVELWVQSATQEPSVRLQVSEPSRSVLLRHHVSEPVLSSTMDTARKDHLCSCNSGAILALQFEVSRLKRELEEGLVQLPHLAQRMDYLTSKYRQAHQERRSKTRPRTHRRPGFNSRQNGSSSKMRIEDWSSSDKDQTRSKDSTDIFLQSHSSPVGGRRGSRTVASPHKLQGAETCAGSEGIYSGTSSGQSSSSLKGDSKAKQRPQKTITESFYSQERWTLLSHPSHQRPLLQVNYGSSSSLPASYKVREPPLQSMWMRSTQSDTALLPSDVYFQRTPSPVFPRVTTKTRSKEEEMNRTLDIAIEVARSMKRTTDHMAKSLSADLAKAKLHRKLHPAQPPGGRKHHNV